ncbi:MAG: ParB/RepB/Spo0J family partition protein, partial [Dehalococcoidales bacterium]|nr:ParB/RepB/Spo0J family partition protein [Dehalococcoidales bacterium]
MSEIQRISIELFDPNPYQPETRIQVNDQVAEQYGKSILQHGLLQTPLARVSPGCKERKEPYRYEMGDGWLRLTGYRWLVKNGHPDFKTIPCELRDLSDEQMAHLVFEANGVRRDLNPIETATYFQKYLTDFKVTEAKLAEIHGLSQGEVANTIRLLQLPQDIQYLVGQGTLSQTHARHLLRLNKVPETQQKVLKEVIKDNIPVSRLANDVEVRLWQMSKSLNAKSDESYNRPTFDVSECKGCEHAVEASYPYGNRKKELRCLKIECWEKKEAAAVATKVKEAKEELAQDFKGQKVFTNKDLPYNQREDLSEYTLKLMDNPGECKKCDKVVLYKYDLTHPGKPEKVCTNPSCLRGKKSKKTRDENKIRSGEDKELTAKLAQAFVHAPSPRAAMLVYARHHLPGISAAAKLDLAVMVPGLPKAANGHLNMDKLMIQVEEKPLDELLKLMVAAEFCQVRRQHSYEKFSTSLPADLKKDLATIEGTLEKHVEVIKAWQEANCRGCSNAKEVLVGSGLECCEYTYNKKILDDGNCERGKVHQAQTESKRASVVPKEGKETEEPTDNTPQSERETKIQSKKSAEKSGIPPDSPAAKAIHALHTNAPIPAGVRRDTEVPKAECEGCKLATEDHTIGMKFTEPSESASDGVSYLKVCVKDWRAHELAQRRADGIQTITDAEGLKTVYCSQAVLETLQEINSAGTLSERKPRLAGLWGLDGKQYACIGTVSSGKDGVLSASIILALPFQETDKIPPGSTGYQGTKCTCRGKEYILAGREIEALPQPATTGKSAGKITGKVTSSVNTSANTSDNTECTENSCPINTADIAKKIKKNK